MKFISRHYDKNFLDKNFITHYYSNLSILINKLFLFSLSLSAIIKDTYIFQIFHLQCLYYNIYYYMMMIKKLHHLYFILE